MLNIRYVREKFNLIKRNISNSITSWAFSVSFRYIIHYVIIISNNCWLSCRHVSRTHSSSTISTNTISWVSSTISTNTVSWVSTISTVTISTNTVTISTITAITSINTTVSWVSTKSAKRSS